jgi:hypothetical protein
MLSTKIYTPQMAPGARRWLEPFRESFHDVLMEIVYLIAEGEKVVGRFRCSVTNLGHGAASRRPGDASSASTRSTSSGSTAAESPKRGASRTPTHARGNSVCHPAAERREAFASVVCRSLNSASRWGRILKPGS